MFKALQPLFEMHNAIDEHYTEEERAIIESYLRRVSHSYDEHARGNTDDAAPTADWPKSCHLNGGIILIVRCNNAGPRGV